MIDISIIIPVYNASAYIERCLESIRRQVFQNYEVIVIDDGSTDDSSQKISKYVDADERFNYYYQKNAGVSSARNNGISRARGKWLMFVDADDWIDDKFCELMISSAEENDLDVIQCRRVDVKEDGQFPQNVSQLEYLFITTFHNFIPTEENFYGTCWGFLYKSEIGKKVMFDASINFTEDALYTIEVMSRSSKIGIINEYLYYYNLMQHDSLSQGTYTEKKYSIIESRMRQMNLFKCHKGEKIMSARLADACLYVYVLGRGVPSYLEMHFKETQYVFRCNFKNWNDWRAGSIIKKIYRFVYFINLELGYRIGKLTHHEIIKE